MAEADFLLQVHTKGDTFRLRRKRKGVTFDTLSRAGAVNDCIIWYLFSSPFECTFVPEIRTMKKCRLILSVLLILLVFSTGAAAQCSICTKTASQLGERPAKALNTGIIYLAFTPLAIMGYVGYRWWKTNRIV